MIQHIAERFKFFCNCQQSCYLASPVKVEYTLRMSPVCVMADIHTHIHTYLQFGSLQLI